jgi:O-antigen ligase
VIARRSYAEPFALLRGPWLPLVLTGIVLAVAMYAASSFPMGLLVAVGIALLPALLALAWTHPLIFPYGAYAMLVPFDLLLSVPELGTVARLCGAISGVALLLWLVRARNIVVPGPALAAWAGLALWSCISLLWTMNTTNASRESGTLVQLACLYAIVSLVPSSLRDVRLVFVAVVCGGLAAALFGIHEFAHPSAAQQLLNEVSDRVPLLVGNQRLDINQFADSLLLPLALVTVGTVRARNAGLKLCGIAAIGVLLYAMSLAASREAFVAVALMFGYFMVVLRERRQIGALAAAVTALALANGNLLHRFLSASATGGSGRLGIWSAGLAAFRQHWLVGAGSGSFAAAYDQVYLKVFQPYDMGWSRAAHNMLLQNGVEYGTVGVALLVFAVILTVRSVPALRQDHPLFGMRASLMGALLGLCVAGLFVDLTTAKVFWLALGLVALVRGCLA